MPKHKVKTSYQKVKLAENNKKKAKAAYGMRMRKSDISPLTAYLLENQSEGKTDAELTEEFREQCAHSFIVIASMVSDSGTRKVYTCKHCYFTEATLGAKKPGLKKKEADGEEDSD